MQVRPIENIASGALAEESTRQGFRDAMARLAAAVNIVATDGPAGRAGFTASAVCSVSDKPPSLLVCLNRSASVYRTFKANEVLCVNTLGRGHEDLAVLFGGKTPMEERFAAASWSRLATGAPVLVDAVAIFDCRVRDIVESGTHDVMFCEVAAVRAGSGRTSLVYFERRFHGLAIAH